MEYKLLFDFLLYQKIKIKWIFRYKKKFKRWQKQRYKKVRKQEEHKYHNDIITKFTMIIVSNV